MRRAGALQVDAPAMVAVHQSVSRDVGPERLPADLSALRRVPDSRALPGIGVKQTAKR